MKFEEGIERINSLQNQINPHFLYNTLECIRSEAISQGNDSIASMAKSLAAFFRYSISGKENIVSVQDEINNIQNYIAIQNYRFEGKFEFRIAVEAYLQIQSYLIPKMTFQPIVENSIYHGLETKSGEGCVNIDIRSTEKDLIIMISDNGVGMGSELLENIRTRLEHSTGERESDSIIHGNGIALCNVNQRIQLLFGKQYGLYVYSTEGVGTDVEILIPIRER